MRLLVALLVTASPAASVAMAAAGAASAPATLALAVVISPAPAAAGPDSGRVVYVTGKRGYLDRGAGDGLAAGAILALRRGKAAGLRCVVEEVSETRATCAGDDLRPGDAFAIRAGEPLVPASAAPELPALLTAVEVEHARRALARAPYALVDEGIVRAAEIDLATTTLVRAGGSAWVSSTGDDLERPHLQLSVRDAPVTGPLAAGVELEAWYWTGAGRERRAELFVWEAALTARGAEQPWALAVGRIWPWHVPGVSVFDGAQVGWRNDARTLEAGLFAGAVPDPETIEPRQRWTGGAYLAHTIDGGGLVRLAREEARVSVRDDADGRVVGEAEVLAQASLAAWLDVGAEARVSSLPSLDGARLHARARPAESVAASLSVRYLGPLRFERNLGPLEDAGLEYVTADLEVSWSSWSWLTASVVAGAAQTLGPDFLRQFVGPEVSLPTLLGRFGGLGAGYREELGDEPGRQGYLQLVLQPMARGRVLVRASYFEDWPDGGAVRREGGLYAYADVPLGGWLTLRASVLARMDATYAEDASSAFGTVARMELEGRF